MAVVQVSRVQHRRGFRIDLPDPLNDAEFGWAEDTRELFIGNGPYHDGNTQILTEHSSATIPPYTYVSNTDITARTGVDPFGDPSFPDPNFDTIRSYQEKFDDIVSVKDYGALGNFDFANPGGSANDTGALIRAMRDVYDELQGTGENRRRAIYLPAGVYRISQAVPLYPFCHLIGDGKGRTIIYLDRNLSVDPNVTFLTGQDCVVRAVDSLGNSGLNLTGSSATFAPTNIRVSNLTLQSNADQVLGSTAGGPLPFNGSIREIAKLDQASKVRFENVEFRGSYTGTAFAGVHDGSVAVLLSKVGDTAVNMNGFTFQGCDFVNLAYAFNVLDYDVSNVLCTDCRFDGMFRAIKIGFDSVVDLTGGTGGTNRPRLFRVNNSLFGEMVENGFDVRTLGRGNISTYNHYTTNNAFPAVRFGTGTVHNASIGDTFDETGSAIDCAASASNLRVRNLGTSNVVMNAQDRFQIPNGFCGTLTVDGDLEVLGNLVLTGSIVTASLPFTLSSTTITSIPFTDGNAIFFEYAFTLTNGEDVHRIGEMKIIHNESVIDYNDTYNELGGPPSSATTLEAVINGSNVDINLVSGLGFANFDFNYTVRVLSTLP